MTEEIVLRELNHDLSCLDRAESEGTAAFRVWTVDHPVVVIGRSVQAEEEVNMQFCRDHGIAVLERPSGGRSVLIGPGTIQYSFTLPYLLDEELGSIAGAKSYCNRLLQSCSPALAALTQDRSGDLTRNGRKIAGLALKRGRAAMLLHGTILIDADLGLIARALRHPKREPHYRSGRTHEEFLTNLSAADDTAGFDASDLAARIAAILGCA